MKHDDLKHTAAYAFRWVVNDFSEMGDPEIFNDPNTMADYIEEILGESDVNDDIVKWARRAKIGDTWEEDDLIITRI